MIPPLFFFGGGGGGGGQNFFVLMSAAYIQVHFRLDFFMEGYNIKPDQTAPGSSLIWVYIVCIIGYLRKKADERAEDKSILAG